MKVTLLCRIVAFLVHHLIASLVRMFQQSSQEGQLLLHQKKTLQEHGEDDM